MQSHSGFFVMFRRLLQTMRLSAAADRNFAPTSAETG